MPTRKAIVAATGLLGLGLLAVVLAARRPAPERAARAQARRVAAAPPAAQGTESMAPVSPPSPAPIRAVALVPAVEEARIRSTYDSYRTAVATGNDELAASLRPVLVLDGETALVIAQEELERAATDEDREIAARALNGLRR